MRLRFCFLLLVLLFSVYPATACAKCVYRPPVEVEVQITKYESTDSSGFTITVTFNKGTFNKGAFNKGEGPAELYYDPTNGSASSC